MGDVLPLYNGEADAYALPAGLDFLSSNNNLLKMVAPDLLQRPSTATYATGHSLQLQSGGMPTKLASWNANPHATNFGEAGSGATLATVSLLAGENSTHQLLKSAFADYNDPTSTIASFLSPRLTTHNLSHEINDVQPHPFDDPAFAARSANLHGLIPSVSPPPLQEPFFPVQEFGQNHGWANAGTELLLLPGSNEALGRSLPHSPASLSPYPPCLPFAQWERTEQITSAKDGHPFLSMDCLQMGGHSQVLSLSLSNCQHQPHSNLHCLDTRISASGSLGIVRNSKYLGAAQQLLDEFCNIGRKLKKPTGNSMKPKHGDKIEHSKEETHSLEKTKAQAMAGGESTGLSYPTEVMPTESLPKSMMHSDERNQLQMKKERLVTMAEEVERACGQYQEQVQATITLFESATGLGGAAPYTAPARQAMSRRFRLLRDSITSQILAVCMALGEEASSVPVLCRGETPRLRILDQQLRHRRALQQIGFLQQQPWRPQRGLPERSVSILRSWLFEHFLDPYPKDSEKLMLSRQTGLTKNQVSNWFINARVRLWKPMIEDMYREEGKGAEKLRGADAGGAAGEGRAQVPECNELGSCEDGCGELGSLDEVQGGEAMGVGQKEGENVGGGGLGDGMAGGDFGRGEGMLYGGRRREGGGGGAAAGVTLTLGLQQSGRRGGQPSCHACSFCKDMM